MKQIRVQDLQIPKDYMIQIENAVEGIKNILKDELLFLVVTGSCGMQSVHENWSDIDLLIVTKRYSNEIFRNINSVIRKSKIKIGVTQYSKYEFENFNVDAKTKYNLILLQKEQIPYIYKGDINIPESSFELLDETNNFIKMEYVHKLKRLISLEKIDVASVVKTMTVLMKMELISNKTIPHSYEQVFGEYAKIKDIPSFDIERIIAKKEPTEDLINYAEYILKEIYK